MNGSKELIKTVVNVAAIIGMLVAGVASYTTIKNNVNQLMTEVENVKRVIDQQRSAIQAIQLEAVQDTADLKSVKEDVGEIKVDVKDIKKSLRP